METNNENQDNLANALALIEKSVLVEINNETKVVVINDNVFENVKQALLNLPKVEILRDAENKIINDFDALENSKKVIKDLRSKIEPIKTNLKEFEKSIKALSNVDDVQARVDELLKIIKTYEENLANVVTTANNFNRQYYVDEFVKGVTGACELAGLSDFVMRILGIVEPKFKETIAKKSKPSVLDTERDKALQAVNEQLKGLNVFSEHWDKYKKSSLFQSKPSNVHKFANDVIDAKFKDIDAGIYIEKFIAELIKQNKLLNDLTTQTQTQKSEPVQQTQSTVAVANTPTSQANETTVTQPAPVTPAPTDNRKVLKPVVFELTITSAKNADFKTDANGIIAFNTKTNTVHVKPREFMKFMQEQGIVNFFQLEQAYGD